jgi:hypothetical protein
MAIFAGAYLTTSLLAAIVIMPLMLKQLAETDYRDVAPMGKDSFTAAAVNSIFASILFIIGWLLTLPLWIIPGLLADPSPAADGLAQSPHLRLRRAVDARDGRRMAITCASTKARCSCSA